MCLGQYLTRQAQIDRAARLRHRDRERAAHHGLELREVAQFVVPLDELAHDRALVERLLAPMDQRVAGAGHPASLSGVRPAHSTSGTLERNAFISAPSALAVPGVVWTIATAGSPVTR